ncbi:MAG: GNAT family N-acetyltransferase [Cellulosilyticaceae bacterium]
MNQTVIIRAIKKEDLKDLSELYGILTGELSDLRYMEKTYDKMIQNPMYLLLGAEVDGKIVGTLMGVVCDDLISQCKAFMTIENVAVAEGYRGYGIGKKLFSTIEEMAKERSCHYVYLVSGPTRKVAHCMYEKLGYAEEGALGFRKYM